MDNFTTTFGNTAADSPPALRAAFIRRTYLHLAAAILGFVLLEAVFFATGIAQTIATTMLSVSWFIVLALFMGVSMLANWWANSSASKPMQYLGLALYVVAEAFIFIPLLYVAAYYSGDGIVTIYKAGIVTLSLFGGLTAIALITRQDFSWLGPILTVAGFLALGLIAASLLFGFSLGSLFAFLMVGFAATSILYSTSNVIHRYQPTQHVAAALSLFASVALLFWYVLRIFTGSRN